MALQIAPIRLSLIPDLQRAWKESRPAITISEVGQVRFSGKSTKHLYGDNPESPKLKTDMEHVNKKGEKAPRKYMKLVFGTLDAKKRIYAFFAVGKKYPEVNGEKLTDKDLITVVIGDKTHTAYGNMGKALGDKGINYDYKASGAQVFDSENFGHVEHHENGIITVHIPQKLEPRPTVTRTKKADKVAAVAAGEDEEDEVQAAPAKPNGKAGKQAAGKSAPAAAPVGKQKTKPVIVEDEEEEEEEEVTAGEDEEEEEDE